MKRLLSIICYIKTIWYTLGSSWFTEGVSITGHDYVEIDLENTEEVKRILKQEKSKLKIDELDSILKCQICPKVSIGKKPK